MDEDFKTRHTFAGDTIIDARTGLEVGIDLAVGKDRMVYLCVCGFETDNADEAVAHVKAHGATRVKVTPDKGDR